MRPTTTSKEPLHAIGELLEVKGVGCFRVKGHVTDAKGKVTEDVEFVPAVKLVAPPRATKQREHPARQYIGRTVIQAKVRKPAKQTNNRPRYQRPYVPSRAARDANSREDQRTLTFGLIFFVALGMILAALNALVVGR